MDHHATLEDCIEWLETYKVRMTGLLVSKVELETVIETMREYSNWFRDYQNSRVTNYQDADKTKLLLDFDGVIHSYKSGWKGIDVVNDAPVEGAIEWLRSILPHFQVCMFSARCNSALGSNAIYKWLLKHGLTEDECKMIQFTPGKPSSFVMIDDRAIGFDGSFELLSPELLKTFRPWYYGKEGYNR